MGAPTDRERQEQTDADKTSPVQGLNERGWDGMAEDFESGAGQEQATEQERALEVLVGIAEDATVDATVRVQAALSVLQTR